MNTPNDKQLPLFSTPEPPPKSSFYDWEIDQQGAEKSINGSGSSLPLDEADKLHLNDKTDTICSDTWISFQESGASAWQQSNLGESRQPSLLKLTSMLKQSSDTSSQEFQFTQTSETTTQNQENLICSQWDSPAQAHQTQEAERDLNIQLPLFGEKDLDVLLKLNPASVLSSNLKELSNEDFELFLADSVWQDTLGKLAMSRRESLGRVIKDSGYLSFPTLTSNVSSMSRPAGQTKCEKWFKDKGLIPHGSQLGTRAIALMMGFPSSWFEGLTQQYSKNQTTPSRAKPQAELEQGIWQEEQLHQDKQRSPSEEFSTSTQLSDALRVLGGDKNSPLQKNKSSSPNRKLSVPCLIKQPKQAEVKGVIKQDLGDRFLVEVDSKEISVSKLFIYPDFRKSDKQIPPTKKQTPPSKSSPTKARRKKGDGTGYIYRRTVTRRGKQYQESYFRYRDESGKLKAKYIPQRLLSKVQEAESAKNKIADILILLGGDEISRGEQSNNVPPQTSQTQDKSDELISISRGEQSTPPSNKKRKQGDGTGYIECKPIKRGGNEYKQYWYHYEEWKEGDRKYKKSRYIPMRLVTRVQKMEAERTPVKTILEVLASKNKRSKK